ncbi:MAG: acyl-ACP--UDP-N-acetylglucosamine O-acyltransferase, partial [Alphaproteobacteria bacterium]
VARGAELDEGVEVGPFATIGPEVRIGAGTRIGAHVVVEGRTTLGRENRVFPFATVGCSPQDLKFRGEPGRLEMGDRNLVREYASLSIGTEGGGLVTRVGNDNLFMNYSHLGHDCQVEDHVHLVNGVAVAGHVSLGSHAIVSGLAAVAQFVRIGEGAFIGGGSMVVMDVPPFCMANGDRARLVGLNAVGLERRGFEADRIAHLRRAYKTLFQSKMLARDAIEKIRAEQGDSPDALALASFVAASERGVTRP